MSDAVGPSVAPPGAAPAPALNPFPGPRPYSAADRARFHGRDEVARRLGGSVLAHRCVTVFGPSGAGKSSLMQAAVIPRFIEEHAFRALRVDSWPGDARAAAWLADAMFDGLKLGERSEGDEPAEAVIGAAQRAARRSDRPLLIYLDQMEQLLYESRDPAQMDELAEALHRLVDLPIRGLKLVLSLREDYLGRFRDRLAGRLPLLDHGFRVGPLRAGELAEAMCQVAMDGEPPQTWSLEETCGLMIQVRTPGQAATDQAEAQAAYAQIVCRALWEQRHAGTASGGAAGAIDVEVILEQYLEATLHGLGDRREDARRLLEEHLVTADGSRTLRTEKELREHLPPEALAEVLRSLEQAAILRAEEHQGRRYFELGHDWLAKKVHDRAEQRRLEEERFQAEWAREQERRKEERAREEERLEEERRREEQHRKAKTRLRRIAVVAVIIAAIVACVALYVAAPILHAYSSGKAFVSDTEGFVKKAKAIDWTDSEPPEEKLARLQPLYLRLQEAARIKAAGPPPDLPGLVRMDEEIEKAVIKAYADVFEAACISPVMADLEARLQQIKGEHYHEERRLLRTYLMLRDLEHLDIQEGAGAISDLWVARSKARSNLTTEKLKEKILPHVFYYLGLLKSERILPLVPREQVIAHARSALDAVPVSKRYHDMFVSSVAEEKWDNAGPDSPENLRYPPIRLSDLLATRPEALAILTSARSRSGGAIVEGPCTEKGHFRVLRNLAGGAALLERERWVHSARLDQIDREIRSVADLYEQRCIDQWTGWLGDIAVKRPSTVSEARATYDVLYPDGRLIEPPYAVISRAVEAHTQWPTSAVDLDAQEASAEKAHRPALSPPIQEPMIKGDARGDLLALISLRWTLDRPSRVPPAFEGFAAFRDGGGLRRHEEILRKLRVILALLQIDQGDISLDAPEAAALLRAARHETEALLKPLDERTRELWAPLLLGPITSAKDTPSW